MPLALDSTIKSIKVSLSGAPAANQPEFVAAYADDDGTTFTEKANDGALNGVTDVTVVAAPASGFRRIVKSIYVWNRDTAAVTVSVKYDNNGTQRTLAKVALQPNETWTLNGAYDANGNLKTSGSGGGVSDHGALTGLGDDDHIQYAILAGRSSGQTLYGSNASGQNLTLSSTSHATKGKVFFGANSALDENIAGGSGFLGIGTTSPMRKFHFAESTGSCEMVWEETNGLTDWKKWNIFINGGTGNKQNMHFRVLNDAGTASMFHFMSFHLSTGRGILVVGNDSPTLSGSGYGMDIAGDTMRLRTNRSPAGSSAGNVGEICWDANYIYVCTATNTWKRMALSSF